MFLYEKTHRYLKNDYRFFDTLKSEDRKIRGNRKFLIKVKFHEFFFYSNIQTVDGQIFMQVYKSIMDI